MTSLSEIEQKSLIEASETVAKNAYAPHSRFHVGAAILSENGNIYTGCNVENASYGLTVCGERNAICHGVSKEGATLKIKAIAISTIPRIEASPCGACRQVISEFGKDIKVFIPQKGGHRETTIEALLPGQFEFDQPIE
ncbi:MAG: cytidine deaminase [Alphaproteobacteria bacterium]|jgi:cytidine deaminase|nr:cytidine deaminase [Alphaproteobacteria bacterium]MBT5390548.1 cytidine deaminase [Alphaproteobacteria bacterium]